MVHLDFPTTNNEAEYKAFVAGLDLAKVAGATSMVVYCDFQMVTSQVNGDFKCKDERMKKYLEQVRKRVGDCLAKATSVEHMLIPSKVLSFIQLLPLRVGVNVQEIGSESNWTTPIVSYKKDGTLLDGNEAAR